MDVPRLHGHPGRRRDGGDAAEAAAGVAAAAACAHGDVERAAAHVEAQGHVPRRDAASRRVSAHPATSSCGSLHPRFTSSHVRWIGVEIGDGQRQCVTQAHFNLHC